MKKIFIILNILIVSNILGQDRNKILQQSNDITLRQAVVDSIVNESFWDTNAGYMLWYKTFYKKNDFSEYAKQKLVSYFDRKLPDTEIDKIKSEAKQRIDRDIEKYKSEAEKKSIDFAEYYKEILNKEIKRDIQIVSKHSRERVSPLYARLLGWLDYKDAIPVLESVLRDSLLVNGYAADNKGELTLNCKLALARMGIKKYEDELLKEYHKIELDCSNTVFFEHINNLFYINTINSINQVVEFSRNNKKYQEIHPDAYKGISILPCTAKPAIYLYLSAIILNYPLEDMFGNKADLYNMDTVMWANEDFYKNQISKLEKWLKENKNNYIINTERFF